MDGNLNKVITGEKRWIASFMLDLVGSTALTEKIGPEQAFLVIEGVLNRVVEIIEPFGGYPVEFAGDSVFAIFGAPVAIDDATLNACKAGIKLQAELAKEQAALQAKFGVAPEVRIGIAGGEVLLAALGFADRPKLNALGSSVNIAARVQTLALPGQVYCVQSVIDELEGFVKTEFVGAEMLKGIETPQNIYRLVEVLDRPSSLDARLARSSGDYVGREGQVSQLNGWLVQRTTAPRAFLVNGLAGIGKSRMVRQALDALPAALLVSIAYCTPDDAHASLRPVLNLIRDAAQVDDVSGPDPLAAWIRRLLPEGETPNADLVDMIARSSARAAAAEAEPNNALDIRRQINALLRTLSCDPQRRLVIEDTHWLDPLSREVVNDIFTDASPGTRLLLTSREAESLGTMPDLVSTLQVEPLTEADIAALIDSAFSNLSTSDEVKRMIFEKSEGNPLFAEELLRHLTPDQAANSKLTLPSGMTGGSIQNLVFSRFDKLAADDKAALKQAAIIGRLIKKRHLEHITGSPEAAQRVLTVAAEHGLIDAAPNTEHQRFAHVLIQDAIESSIPGLEAQKMHLKAAEILLETDVEKLDELAPNLASHFDLAGMPEQAIAYYVRSAQSAWKIYALDTCQTHIGRAEALLSDDDISIDDTVFADMITLFCRVLDVSGNWGKLISLADQHMARLSQLESRKPLSICLTMQAKGSSEIGQFDDAMRQVDQALAIAEEDGDENAMAVAKTVKMDVLNDCDYGTFEDTVQLFDETQAYAESGQDSHMALLRLYEMSTCYRRLGDTTKASELVEQMIQYGSDHNDARAFTFGNWAKALLLTMVEDYDGVKKAVAHSTLPGTFDYTTAQVLSLGARILTGDTTITNEYLEEIYAERVACGDISVAVVTAFFSASVYFINGEIRAGWARLERAEQRMYGGVERGLRAAFYIKKAELLLTIRDVFPSPTPKPKLALAELPMALKLRLKSVRMASDLYDRLDAEFDFPDGYQRARIEMGRGLVARARGKRAMAQAHFETSLAMFETQKFHFLTDHVRSFMT